MYTVPSAAVSVMSSAAPARAGPRVMPATGTIVSNCEDGSIAIHTSPFARRGEAVSVICPADAEKEGSSSSGGTSISSEKAWFQR